MHFTCTKFNSCVCWVCLCVNKIFKILTIWRHNYFFGKMWVAQQKGGCCVVAFGGSVDCACVPQLFNSLLTPIFVWLFSGNSSTNLFAVYLFKYKLIFIKILSSSLNTTMIGNNHCSEVLCDEFLEPQIDCKSK